MQNQTKLDHINSKGLGFKVDIQPRREGYIILEGVATEYESLIDAMKHQAKNNKKICDEIIAKSDKLSKEYKKIK